MAFEELDSRVIGSTISIRLDGPSPGVSPLLLLHRLLRGQPRRRFSPFSRRRLRRTLPELRVQWVPDRLRKRSFDLRLFRLNLLSYRKGRGVRFS